MPEFYRSSVELQNLFTLTHCVSHLKLKPADCSPLGKLLLRHVDEHPKLNLSKLAKEIGMSRPGLGWICLKPTSPNEETSKKLAAVLGLEEREVARLVHWNKLENLENLELIEALRDSDDMLYRESPRLSDFQLYRQLLKR